MGLVDNKTVVITGAASGIGREMALRFAEEGADVVVADVRREPRGSGMPTHKIISRKTDVRAKHIFCDVSNVGDIEAAIDAADEFGGVSILVNNAGILTDTPFFEVTEQEYNQIMDVNVKGQFFAAQYAADRMRSTDTKGAILNISSTLGIRGSGDLVAYTVSKGAVKMLTYALASELGPEGIRVNAIHPGTIDTEMNRQDLKILGTEKEDQLRKAVPLRRLGIPQEVADAAVYLASDMSSYVNAESLIVDGGGVNTS
jgi:NAD(P)-dependent dehydrogenase (short-subunit alcohol dehydrogenase family)